ncbi:TGF-beta-activated kinase 1 and MAP3K7-binding protein 2 [Geodia barretti]|jgi:septal ring factor EnvC (AmiA/AmiB activator)|nr:TGF-beta-activated kinase 1 and MAP3K7-binding protein 2 [Geodia barretti]
MYGGAGAPNAEIGYHDFRWSGYDSNASTRQVYDRQLTLPRKRDVNFGVTAVSIFAAQEQQLEALQRHHEGQRQQLTYMRQTLESSQHQLSRLRMDVSAIPSPQQMGELKEVIQTLEIDLREARNNLQVQTVQSKMKEEQDLYTDEGVRWYCADCSFLNHPLMTLCEKCSIPRARSAS